MCSVSASLPVSVVAVMASGRGFSPRVAAGAARGSTVRGPAGRGGCSFLCTAAVLNGNTSFEDVAAWVSHAPQEMLAACGARGSLGIYAGPHPDTVERIFRALAAAAHGTGAVLAERLIGPKTNEVPEFGPLLLELNRYCPLAGHVITADAGHTVRAHATLICEKLLAHYVFTVKLNTPALWAELDALDWGNVPRLVTGEEATAAGSGAPSRSRTPPRTSERGSRMLARQPSSRGT